MPFPYDKYPWINYQELNLAYFIEHFQEIFQQWDQLYHDLLSWQASTEEDLEAWKTAVEGGLESWKTGVEAGLETWKTETQADITGWETATLAALDAWKVATTAVFEEIRTAAAASATAAAGSATDAATAKTAAQTAQASAEAAAAGIQSELTQIQTNTEDIADLKNAFLYRTADVNKAFAGVVLGFVNSVGRYSNTTTGVRTSAGDNTPYIYKGSSFTANSGYTLSYAFWKVPIYANTALTERIAFARNIPAGQTVTAPENCYAIISASYEDESEIPSGTDYAEFMTTALTIDVYYTTIREYVDNHENEIEALNDFATNGNNDISVLNKKLVYSQNVAKNTDYVQGYTIDLATGELIETTAPNVTASDYFLIKSSTAYYMYNSGTKIAFYDFNKKFISGKERVQSDVTVISPSNACYARMSAPASPSLWNISEGNEFIDTPYFEPYFTFEKEIGVLNDFATDKNNSTNVLNKKLVYSQNVAKNTDYVQGYTIDLTTGELTETTAPNVKASDYFLVKSSTTYYMYNSGTKIAFYDFNKKFVSGKERVQSDVTVISPSNACYARMSAPASPSLWNISEGNEFIDTPYFEPYFTFEKGEQSPFYIGELSSLPSDVSTRYSGMISDYLQPSLNRNTTYADVITLFDSLMNSAPTGYITKADLGEASGQIEGATPHVYEYTFNPGKCVIPLETKIQPKILIDGSMHGFEKNSTYAWYFFLRDLVENYKGNPSLAYIRANVVIKFIPVLNPYGFDNNAYLNGNGVNINRNFDTPDWTYVEPGTTDASGNEPMDQPETQIVAQRLLNNPDAFMYINTHTNGQYYTSGYGQANANLMTYDPDDAYQCRLLEVFRKHVQMQTLILPEEFAELTPPFGTFIGRDQSGTMGHDTHPGTISQYLCYQHKLGFSFELFNGLTVNEETIVPIWSANAKKICSEIAGNMILEVIAEFSR